MTRDKVVIVGLGYVGLPLARAFHDAGVNVAGFDVDEAKARSFAAEPFPVSSNAEVMRGARFFIVCVPTPADERGPDTRPIACAAASIVPHVEPGSIVVVESTVHIGGTDFVRRELQSHGARGFAMAFAPERVSPGDRGFAQYVKVIAADAEGDTLRRVEALYRRVFERVHVAPSIKTAEAAKLLENAQRDVNIALINEAAAICESHGVSIHDVLDAASTKWNFARYEPGLVGGHCIAVDPWLLLRSAEEPEASVIAAARQVNDAQPTRIAAKIRALASPCKRALILGAAFKPNVDDMRNSGALRVAEALRAEGVEVDVYDPICGVSDSPRGEYDVIALLVRHDAILEELPRLAEFMRPGGAFFDPWNRGTNAEPLQDRAEDAAQ